MEEKTVREKARHVGVKNYARFKKEDLIRTIQAQEGNQPCFKAIHDCWEFGCLWREECQS